ncbi:hypothetical protein PVA45_03090 [Entomospira entomophila]|uniref:Uncharacterized protein n=1 Tax=Entomospira entomophila TaxID=2719988 RepID=A0A968KR75_9SPIO|nr:hypothetical protein [Entomospira entomophilus]NIZ40499.1 hypothetical protein [Entomospira entomophilus]WDI36058.1 hypothetical protein PVA45_03090 [Entomospira entomophilus]
MHPAPPGEHLQIAGNLLQITSIATPALAIISFRLFPLEGRELLIILFWQF